MAMGRLGIEAWENDAAANWYDRLFEETELAHRIAEALILDPEENFDEIRAAAKLVILLDEPGVWPTPSHYRTVASLACRRLNVLVEEGHCRNSKILESIADDVVKLQAVAEATNPEDQLSSDTNRDFRPFEP